MSVEVRGANWIHRLAERLADRDPEAAKELSRIAVAIRLLASSNLPSR
jgi:hypothetical protein